MGALQRRIGPNKVGYLGVLQPFNINGMVIYSLFINLVF